MILIFSGQNSFWRIDQKSEVVMKILIVAAHPDDEILGCGGTIARAVKEKHDVYTLILGEGITSRNIQGSQSKKALIEALHDKCHAAGKSLGVKETTIHNFPDNRFDTIPLLDIVRFIEDHISKIGPSTIYTHHGGDLNIDHQLVFRALLAATRPMPGQNVQNIYSFEVPSSTDWAFQQISPAFRPNVFVDIRESLHSKIEALMHYDSEVRAFPHPRSADAIRAQSCRWGSVAGCEAAEAFQLVRSLH